MRSKGRILPPSPFINDDPDGHYPLSFAVVYAENQQILLPTIELKNRAIADLSDLVWEVSQRGR